VVRPDVATSRRREMAKRVVAERGLSIRLACLIFSVSQTCYRYEAKKNAENEQIANWLLRLTDNHRNWGFWSVISTCVTLRALNGTTSASIAFMRVWS